MLFFLITYWLGVQLNLYFHFHDYCRMRTESAPVRRTMLMKGCLHTHTTCSDGKLTPQQVAEIYEEKGYDFIAFTDQRLPPQTGSMELYGKVISGMIIFEGIELTVFVKGYVHVNTNTR